MFAKALLEKLSKGDLKPTTTVVRSGCTVSGSTETKETGWVKTASGWVVEGSQDSGSAGFGAKSKHLTGTHAEMHGSLGERIWKPPALKTFCAVQARPGYDSCEAHEYQDEDEVMEEKVKVLADLITKSRCTILYTGAGISTASGISDYATRSAQREESTEKIVFPLNARPSKSHRILVALYRAGLIKGWIQQNHDGLPQKAGLPQSAINGTLSLHMLRSIISFLIVAKPTALGF
jgi:hypothetical protein